MSDQRLEAEDRIDREPVADALLDDEDDPFEEWERYPAQEAEEQMSYQRLAWYAAPFGSAGVTLLIVAAFLNTLRRAGRAAIRLLLR